VKEEKFLITTEFAVITLGSFLLKAFPFLQLFRIWKAHSIDTLQRFCVCVPFPVRARTLDDLCGPDFACVAYVRTPAKVDQWAASKRLIFIINYFRLFFNTEV
jgi:hypothetical protein